MDEQLKQRMTVAKVMMDNYTPPDVSTWVEALEGCAELYQHAANHLKEDPPDYGEAAHIIAVAVKAASTVHNQAMMSFALSGQAGDQMLDSVYHSFSEDE